MKYIIQWHSSEIIFSCVGWISYILDNKKSLAVSIDTLTWYTKKTLGKVCIWILLIQLHLYVSIYKKCLYFSFLFDRKNWIQKYQPITNKGSRVEQIVTVCSDTINYFTACMGKEKRCDSPDEETPDNKLGEL